MAYFSYCSLASRTVAVYRRLRMRFSGLFVCSLGRPGAYGLPGVLETVY